MNNVSLFNNEWIDLRSTEMFVQQLPKSLLHNIQIQTMVRLGTKFKVSTNSTNCGTRFLVLLPQSKRNCWSILISNAGGVLMWMWHGIVVVTLGCHY